MKRIHLREGELSQLIRESDREHPVNVAFGIGWVDLRVDEEAVATSPQEEE